jgi:DnaK suppressor protein
MHVSLYPEFRDRLEEKAHELTAALRDRNAIAVERMSDAIDDWAIAADREMSALALQSGSDLLRQVRLALQAIDDGVYGVCVSCEEEVSLKRLRAVPWALRCVQCQEKEDAAKARERFSEAA